MQVVPKPKPQAKAAPKKVAQEEQDRREHVNIIFIGHVGKSTGIELLVQCSSPPLSPSPLAPCPFPGLSPDSTLILL